MIKWKETFPAVVGERQNPQTVGQDEWLNKIWNFNMDDGCLTINTLNFGDRPVVPKLEFVEPRQVEFA